MKRYEELKGWAVSAVSCRGLAETEFGPPFSPVPLLSSPSAPLLSFPATSPQMIPSIAPLPVFLVSAKSRLVEEVRNDDDIADDEVPFGAEMDWDVEYGVDVDGDRRLDDNEEIIDNEDDGFTPFNVKGKVRE